MFTFYAEKMCLSKFVSNVVHNHLQSSLVALALDLPLNPIYAECIILINWTSQFPILGLLGGIFHFYSNFKRNILHFARLIWFCTVCRCHTKRTLGLYGLKNN